MAEEVYVKRRFLFVAESVNEHRQMAFFLLCVSEQARDTERGGESVREQRQKQS